MSGILSYALTLSTSAFTGPLSAASGAIRGTTSMLGTMAATAAKATAALGALGGGVVGGVGIFQALTKAADFESMKVGFTTILGSAKAADAVMKELRSTAASTPYGITELAQSARSLMAVTERDQITPTLRMIGDLASAAQKPITELASMYAKIKGGDVVRAEDLNQISDALPGALGEFAKVLGVDSVAAVRKLGEEGAITGATLDQVFVNLTSKGGMAFDAMKAQSQTTTGLISTLKDSVDELLVAIGTPINDLLKPMIEANTGRIAALTIQFKSFLELLASAGKQGNLGELIGVSLKLAMIDSVNLFAGGIRGAVDYLGTALPLIFTNATETLMSSRITLFFKALFDGVANQLRAALEAAAAGLAGAVGRIGMKHDLEQSSRQSAQRASMGYYAAKGALAGGDFGEGIKQLAKANAAGVAAFKKAMATPLLDRAPAMTAFTDLAKKLNPQALANLLHPTPETAPPASPLQLKPPISKAPSKAELATIENAAAAARQWNAENAILIARGGHHNKLATALERELKLEEMKLKLMKEQGLTKDDAAKQAETRLALEDRAAGKRGSGGPLARAAAAAAKAEAALARGGAAADPARDRREAAADAKRAKADDPLVGLVKSISAKFDKLAVA